ncbi:hypothetical protein GOV09_01150 [Candidatus Woesearchaeota archaeon]|nr:hypothetical protein [Candidatus Woesearchaeota archaeon]
MAKLRPSQRERKRYIVYQIQSQDKFSFAQVSKAIQQTSLRLLGEFGWERANMYIIKNTFSNNQGMLRVNNKMLNDTKKALLLVKSVAGKKIILNIKGISGILKKAKNKFLR